MMKVRATGTRSGLKILCF